MELRPRVFRNRGTPVPGAEDHVQENLGQRLRQWSPPFICDALSGLILCASRQPRALPLGWYVFPLRGRRSRSRPHRPKRHLPLSGQVQLTIPSSSKALSSPFGGRAANHPFIVDGTVFPLRGRRSEFPPPFQTVLILSGGWTGVNDADHTKTARARVDPPGAVRYGCAVSLASLHADKDDDENWKRTHRGDRRRPG